MLPSTPSQPAASDEQRQPDPVDHQAQPGVAQEIPEEYLALFAALEAEEELPDFMLEYEEVPLLLVDTDGDRALARQKEMMGRCFGGIGEETKTEKRMGLAMQQLDIEQRHALRLLLIYEDPQALAAHLSRCLEDPAFGYGERGDNGRTIAQAMAAVAGEGDLAAAAAAWLETNREFQQRILGGAPMSFRSMFDYADLTTFIPLLQRVDEHTWRLGVKGEGKHQDFHGPLVNAWPRIGDAYVKWCHEDNEAWLNQLKRKAAKVPDSILRAARADRLRKEKSLIQVQGSKIGLTTERNGEDWPRMIVMKDAEGNSLLGLSRLSGHSFYELAWNGALNVRRFELSSTTRNKVPFEHIELATMLAEALGAEQGLVPDPVEASEVEAAYLRRMKVAEAEIGPARLTELPQGVQGKAVASYKAGEVLVTMLRGGEDIAYITLESSENAFLLRRDNPRGLIAVWPVVRRRPRIGGAPLMSTLLAELDLSSSGWNRAISAWGAWLASVLK